MPESEISVPAGDVSLAGTLLLPDESAGPWPLAIFLHGSGPQDRNENLPVGQKLDVFNTLADGLAARGIASIRYDKRGCGKSTGDYYEAGLTEVLADAIAVLDHFAADPRFAGRYAVGHSEGTILAAQLSLTRQLDGMALLCPFIEDGESILMSQAGKIEDAFRAMPGASGAINRLLMRLIGKPSAHQRRLIDRLHSTSARSFRQGLRRIPAAHLRDLLNLDATAIYREVTTPALVLGGGKDLQCDPADVGTIAGILGDRATAVVMPDLTHILRNDPGEHTFASYGALVRKPMEPAVTALVCDWLSAQARAR